MKSYVKYMSIAGVVVIAAFATIAEGSSSGDGGTIVESSSEASPVDEQAESDMTTSDESEVTDEADASGGDLGTRENPAPLGSVAKIGDWEISITKVNQNAAKLIAKENPFNEPPADGFSFVNWSVEATYVGENSGTLWLDTTMKVVGADGNSFSDSCGVTPKDISDAGETFPGGSVSGNECVAVETAQLEGATILVEASFSFDDNRTFFAIK